MTSQAVRSGSPPQCARTRLCTQPTERPASKSLLEGSRKRVGTATTGLTIVFRRHLGKTSTYNIHDSQAEHRSISLISLDFQPRRPDTGRLDM